MKPNHSLLKKNNNIDKNEVQERTYGRTYPNYRKTSFIKNLCNDIKYNIN